MRQMNLLVVGDSCLDTYRFGTVDRVSPEAPIPVLRFTREESRPGMAQNVAQNLRGMGARVDIMTNSYLPRKVRYVDERSHYFLLRTDHDDVVEESLFLDLAQSVDPTMYDALVVSDYGKGYLRDVDGLECLLSSFRKAGLPVFVDTKMTDLSLFSFCTVKINEHERSLVSSIPFSCQIVVTLGSRGALWNEQVFPSDRVGVFDVCGAGDTFLAGLTVGYIHFGGDMKRSIEFANQCSAVAIQNLGTYAVTTGDIRSLVGTEMMGCCFEKS